MPLMLPMIPTALEYKVVSDSKRPMLPLRDRMPVTSESTELTAPTI